MFKRDLTGKVYGRLTVLAWNDEKRRQNTWSCVCECGNRVIVKTGNLNSGNTKSCGCLQRQRTRETSITHNHYKSPEYKSWTHIHDRCYNPRNRAYARYGGRGILICDRWHKFNKNGFLNFLHDMGRRPKAGMSVERKDNNMGYSPENCVWATPIEQANNQRTNLIVRYFGRALTAAQFAREIGVKSWRVYRWIKKGMDAHHMASVARMG